MPQGQLLNGQPHLLSGNDTRLLISLLYPRQFTIASGIYN